MQFERLRTGQKKKKKKELASQWGGGGGGNARLMPEFFWLVAPLLHPPQFFVCVVYLPAVRADRTTSGIPAH